jgi:hypothetical protein
VAKPERLHVERLDIGLDRPHRIVAIHIIFNARRKKARLLPAAAGLEGVIRHKLNRTPSRRTAYEFLPSLFAQPILQDFTKPKRFRKAIEYFLSRHHLPSFGSSNSFIELGSLLRCHSVVKGANGRAARSLVMASHS